MSKRSANELSNSSKRLKTNDVMPPPQFISTQKPPPPILNFNLKSQASVTDPKPDYIDDDDEDEEELWIQASQIEQRVLAGSKIINLDDQDNLTYSEFQTAEAMTSTQVASAPTVDLTRNDDHRVKVQILQNKCAALEKQLKKYKPNFTEITQRANEMSELKERIKKLSSENDELRREKLGKEIEEGGGLWSENEKLKREIARLKESENGRNLVNRSVRSEENGHYSVGIERNLMKNGESSRNCVGKYGNFQENSRNPQENQRNGQGNRRNVHDDIGIFPQNSRNLQNNPGNDQKSSKNYQNGHNVHEDSGTLPQNSRNYQQNSENFQESSSNSKQSSRNVHQNPRNFHQNETNSKDFHQNSLSSRNFYQNSTNSRNFHQNSTSSQQNSKNYQQIQTNFQQNSWNFHQSQTNIPQNLRNNPETPSNSQQSTRNFQQNTRNVQQNTRNLQQNSKSPTNLSKSQKVIETPSKIPRVSPRAERRSSRILKIESKQQEVSQIIGNSFAKPNMTQNEISNDPRELITSQIIKNRSEVHQNGRNALEFSQKYGNTSQKYGNNSKTHGEPSQRNEKTLQNFTQFQFKSTQNETTLEIFKNPEIFPVTRESQYHRRKLALWNSHDNSELFKDTNESEILDLIKKVQSFNIFSANKLPSFQKGSPYATQWSNRITSSFQKCTQKSNSSPKSKSKEAKIQRVTNTASTSSRSSKKSIQSFDPIRNPYGTINLASTTIKINLDPYKVTPQDSENIASLKLIISKKINEIILKTPHSELETFIKVPHSELDTFNEILTIIVHITNSIKFIEERRINEHFMRQEFACKQAEYFSDHYFAECDGKISANWELNDLISTEKFFEDEWRIEQRRLIALISIICTNSKEISEKFLTQNISSNSSEYRTVIDEICNFIDPYIIHSRLLFNNSGLTMALSELLNSIAIHYENFQNNPKIDEMLMKFFNHLLTMSTNNPKILNNYTKFLIKISNFPIISKFCINFPSSQLEFSRIFRIFQIPRHGCLLQIYFCLMSSVFRYKEDVREERIDDLFELTMNLNTFVSILLAKKEKLKFLEPQNDALERESCKCYKFLSVALLTLNEKVLRHRNHDCEKNFYKLRSMTRTAVINIAKVMSLSRRNVSFWKFNFGHNLMNEISSRIEFDRIVFDEKHFECMNVLLLEKYHDDFLKKLHVWTRHENDDDSEEEQIKSTQEREASFMEKQKNNELVNSLLLKSKEKCFDF